MKNLLFIIIFLICSIINAEIIEINQNGSGDYTIIQSGITASVDGDTVLVYTGTYYENINFLGKKITVASEYLFSGVEEDIESTIIDGSGLDTVVRMESGEDTLSYLCGFVIRNGYFWRGGGIRVFQSGAKLEHLKIRDNIAESENSPSGGGIIVDGDCYVHNVQHPPWPNIVIRNTEVSNNNVFGNCPSAGGINICRGINQTIIDNVTVTDNHCEGNLMATKGGVYIYKANSVSIRNCNFVNNSVSSNSTSNCGGLACNKITDLLIDNCEITGNSVESNWSSIGGIYINTEGDAIVRNTLIADNSVLGFSSSGAGGGTFINGDFLVEDCEIRGNSTIFYNGDLGGGGGLCFGRNSSTIINRSLFYDNTGGRAAGSIFHYSYCILINSVIANNHSDVCGGFGSQDNCRLRVINSIFWNNENSEIRMEDPRRLEIYHSIIEDGEDGIEYYGETGYLWGEGNLESNPLFVDAANGDFHLQEESPGIDSGMCAYQDWGYNTHLIPEDDIIGRHRDMGVFETGIEDNTFDLPAYLVTDEDYSVSLDLDDYLGGLSGDITIYNEDHLESLITGNIINWQPEENWFGFDEVWIDLETTTGETYSDYIFIDITGINDAPEINLPESISFNNIGHISFNVLQYIFDAEGELLDISTVGSEHINTWVNSPYLSLEAEPGWQGTETITVYALDDWQREVASDTMQVEVYCEPVADCGTDLYGRDGAQVLLDGSASLDPLLNGLSYQWSTDPGLIIDNADSVIAIATTPEIEEMAEALIYLEVNDGYNSSTDSLFLTYLDDEPLEVEIDIFPASDVIRIYWDEPEAAGCGQIELTGYQMYFEGCEYDTLQNVDERIYTFNLPEGDYNFGVQAVYSDGESDIVEVNSVDVDESELIAVTGLTKIYPNPFNPEVNIEFELAKSEKVLLVIYNIKGQKIRTLVDDTLAPDNYTIIWKGDDESGNNVSSGIYFVRLKAGDEYLSQQKLTVVK